MKPTERLAEARKQLDLAMEDLSYQGKLTDTEERWLNDAGRNVLAVETIHNEVTDGED